VIHFALLIFHFGFGRNKTLNSASVSFSAETTLLYFGPVLVSDEFIKNQFQSVSKGTTDGHDMCEWVNVSSGTGSSELSRTKSRVVKRLYVYGNWRKQKSTEVWEEYKN